MGEINPKIAPRWLMRGVRVGLGQGLGGFGNYMIGLHPVYGPLAGLILNSISKAVRDQYTTKGKDSPWWARVF